MAIITKMLKMDAVWWPVSSYDNDGDPVLDTPVDIKVRWEDKTEEFLDAEGTTQISNAIVYVDRDVTTGGVLWLGLLADGPDLLEPKENVGAWEIRKFEKLPDLKVRRCLRTVYL